MPSPVKTIDFGHDHPPGDWTRLGLVLAGIAVGVAVFALALASATHALGIIPELARCRSAARAASAADVAMLDQEMSLRAYLMTRDARHLDAYQRADLDRAGHSEEIQAYAAPVAELTGTLRRAQVAEQRWRDGWAHLAAAPTESGYRASRQEGKSLFDAYRREQSAFAGALDQRRDRLSRQEYAAIGVLGALALTALLAVLSLVLRDRREPGEAIARPANMALYIRTAMR
ncbi:MAG: CHASE3 domain-containing protein [Byssovorax sp.]